MRFKTKLYAGFGIVLAMLLLLSGLGSVLLGDMNGTMKRIVNDNFVGVKLVTSIRGEVNTIGRELNALLLNLDTAGIQSHKQPILESRSRIERYWEQLLSLSTAPGDTEALARLSAYYVEYSRGVDRLIQLAEDGNRSGALTAYYDSVQPTSTALFETIRTFSAVYEDDMEKAIASYESVYRSTLYMLTGFVVLLVAISASVAGWVLRSVGGSLGEVANVMKGVTFDDTSRLPRIEVRVDDEIGNIARAYNQMAAALEKHALDVLHYQAKLEDYARHKARLADMSAKLQGVHDVYALGSLFVNEIAPMAGAGYAVLYQVDSEDGVASGMNKLAAYADDGEDVGSGEAKPGVGLVAQCARENKRILLDRVPGSHIRVRSGLGSSEPAHLLLLPVSFEGKAIAVLELASFSPFDPSKLDMLEEMNALLGTALDSVSAYAKIRKLLTESQLFSEELQAQSEELQLQQEELRALNEQLEVQYKHADRKNKELELVRQALEETNRRVVQSSRYKTEFLANVSHELRTPLNSLLLLAQLLAENKEGNLTPKQKEYVRTIYGSGADLLNRINDILDLSKIEAGKMELVRETVTPAGLADFAKSRFWALASRKGLEFRIDVRAGEENAVIETDVRKLEQIVGNLLSNAIKFTESGTVTLSIGIEPASPEPPAGGGESPRGGTLRVTVADTGIGVPAEKRDAIFEPFRQADGTTSRKYGGTGLGLSISRELVVLLGGTIALESEEGKGSAFTVAVPLMTGATDEAEAIGTDARYESAAAAETSRSGADAADAAERLSGRKILLVDDDMRNIFALTGVLESFGTNVIFAENGLEALELLERNTDTDLVLMDIMMPKMDGYEAIRTIRASDAPYRQLPIIALTAKAMKHDKEKCIEAGANDYISKPIQFDQLVSLLKVWLHR
ncbi:response regulator [Paenibacillus flagellatus]|uniref:Circadian input-output histidine kinase CikA n=1 Tax=Paenibacillus flagellatus TaxID=2211139 RepID=A0A2V5K4V6_9BACL|nr:response regulator [Paenibacillus flagellatus]PYI54375.1 hypothetical protein DLM86_12950 [Paenibacillus flagellatus]